MTRAQHTLHFLGDVWNRGPLSPIPRHNHPSHNTLKNTEHCRGEHGNFHGLSLGEEELLAEGLCRDKVEDLVDDGCNK